MKDNMTTNYIEGSTNDSLSMDYQTDWTNLTLPIDMQFNDGHVILISCYSVIFLVSLIGNTCVLWAILGGRRRKRKSRVNMMLLHLAIADLIVTTVMIPVEVGWALTVQWTAGDVLCRFFAFFRIFGHYLSSFILVCISIDRYFAVVHPLSLSAADRRGKLMVLMAWLLAFSCSLPQVIIFHVDNHPHFKYYVQCVTFGFFPTPQHEMVYNIFCLVMLYVVPLFIIIFFYGAIVSTIVHKSRFTTDEETTIRRSSLGYLGKARARTIKMTISIVVAFFVCWTPYVIISLWFCFDRKAANDLDIKVQKALFIFACTNSCANPIVYGIFNFCKRSPRQVETWRTTTFVSKSAAQGYRQSERHRCPRDYYRRTLKDSVADNTDFTDVTSDLLPRALNSPARSQFHSGNSGMRLEIPLHTLSVDTSAMSKNCITDDRSPSSATSNFHNGSYYSSVSPFGVQTSSNLL